MDRASLPTKKKKKNIVSANFGHAVFSLLDFLTWEDGIDWLSINVGKELSLFCVISQRSTDLT